MNVSRSLNADPQTRPSLLIRLRNSRDDLAWTEFTAVYEPVIYRMAQHRGLQDADAREVVQEVLMSVAAAIDRFDVEDSGSFRGWLSRITRNAAVDRFRALATLDRATGESGMREQLASASQGTETDMDAAEQEFDLQRRQQLFRWAAGQVRQRTGEVNWMAFWRTSVESKSIDQVALELGISKGAVSVARCRILKRIRDMVHQRINE